VYNVRVDHIAEDVPPVIRAEILAFLNTYNFQHVTAITDKMWLRTTFTDFFNNRRPYDWLKAQVYAKAGAERWNLTGVVAVAMTEPNRIHTGALGNYLLKIGQTKCRTIHTYGTGMMQPSCRMNLEEKILDIKTVLANTFPPNYDDLKRTDVSMIPQHPNCHHVMAPLVGVEI
jgi:hypothetical protein